MQYSVKYVKIISLMRHVLHYSALFHIGRSNFHVKNLQVIWTNEANENELVGPEEIKFNSKNDKAR